MREIKFRAWDGKRMWFSGQEGEEDERGNTYQLYYDRDAGTYKASLLGPQFLVATDPYPMYHPGEEVECQLMQYTGLKDKNGKEVCEGDIVDQSYISPMTKELVKRHYVVEWENGKYKMTFIKDKMHYDKYLWMEFMRVEVLGNIYENPELLK